MGKPVCVFCVQGVFCQIKVLCATAGAALFVQSLIWAEWPPRGCWVRAKARQGTSPVHVWRGRLFHRVTLQSDLMALGSRVSVSLEVTSLAEKQRSKILLSLQHLCVNLSHFDTHTWEGRRGAERLMLPSCSAVTSTLIGGG